MARKFYTTFFRDEDESLEEAARDNVPALDVLASFPTVSRFDKIRRKSTNSHRTSPGGTSIAQTA